MKIACTLFVALLSLAAFAADPVATPKRRSLGDTMTGGLDSPVDDGAGSVVNSFGPAGEAQCTTKANTACGNCSMTCPVGKAVVCVAGVPSDHELSGAGPKCVRPPSCTCK